jgi:two-component system, cell cycle response regulator CpdR
MHPASPSPDFSDHAHHRWPVARLLLLPALLSFILADPAQAVQSHGGPEGMVVHQLGHVLFAGGMLFLLVRSVEDKENVRKVTFAMLAASGYQVWEAANPAEAGMVFAQEKGAFDLVLSDIMLPGGNGLQVMEQLQAARPGLPVLLMSGYADEKSQWPIIKEKDVPFLQKPFTFNELLIAIRKILEKREAGSV